MIFLRIRELEREQMTLGKEGEELTFNIFQMMSNMGVKPEDWISELERRGVKPFELLGIVDELNYTRIFRDARVEGTSTRMKIEGSFGFQISGLHLTDPFFHTGNDISYEIAPERFYADTNLANFWNVRGFSQAAGTFAIYS